MTAPTCALLTALAYLASTPREFVIFLTGFHAFLLAAISLSYVEFRLDRSKVNALFHPFKLVDSSFRSPLLPP